MQPRVTVALATVWFTVAGLVGGTVTLRLSNDQYSPASPHRYAELQRDQTRDWRAHGPAEDQPLDLWIDSRRSISAEELKALRHNAKFAEQNFSLEKPLKDIVSKRVYSLSSWQKRLSNIATTEFAADKVDYGYDMPETLSRETMVPRSDLLDDPFVADDTFQDQGPGSMEIYKLDLSKEKALLTATTPPTNFPSKNKSKAPKKTGHLNLKTKTTEIKSTTIDPKVHHKQSNFFEEQRTETPSVNRDAFGVGGVPELQVGCEGLEASPSSHKTKRSIDTPDKQEGVVPSVLLDVMPISLDLDYNPSYDEENYEEMDELFKLKKLETTAKKNKPNRGDMDASHLNSDHLDESRRSEKLPIRGDLGKFIPRKSGGLEIDREKSEKSTDLEMKKGTKAKRALILSNDAIRNRRLLWLAEANTEGFAGEKSGRKRARRSTNWGFGENEGVVSSDELQTVNERRRQHEMRYHQDVSRRRDQHRGINPDIDNIRQEYENLLEQKRREEEERRMQQGGRKTLDRWEEEERRRDEMRKTQHDKYRDRIHHTSTPRMDDEEMRRRQMQERQRQEMERNRTQEMARREEEERRRFREAEEQRRRLQGEEKTKKRPYNTKWKEENARKSESETPVSNEKKKQRFHDEETRREEERQRQLQKEEARKREQYRSQQEALKRKEEEERRRQEDRARNLPEDDRRRLEERRREWSEKKRQQEEDETRRQQPPSNLMRTGHQISHPNDVRQRDRDEERRTRVQDERQREQKLREYIARNQPINATHADRRSEEQNRRYRPEEGRDPRMNASRDDDESRTREQRKRQEEERKLQDYIRRNQPVNVPSRSNQSAVTDRNWFEERRLIEEVRRRDPISYPDSETRRQHGPSAPTYNIDRRTSPETLRRMQQETERRLKEARRRQREEEERRLREERMRRQEAVRREEEARKVQSRRYEENRKRLEATKLQAERRRQEMLKEQSRSEAGRTRQPEATRPTYYQDRRLLMEHRRRQDSLPIPSNFVRDEGARRVAAERERQRLEAEKRRQDESRMREYKPKETNQWRRQELVRLNSLPVSARIIVTRPGPSSVVSPVLASRTGFNNEIDFTGINPHREGIQVSNFPVSPTSRPPPRSPGPCIWAIVQCCSPNNNRLVKCFESMGCPGVNWDPNPCRGSIANAARAEVMKFYNASNQ
ncbi:Reticulocyte-binding protein 2-like protein a [Camponotus japonicus]